MTPNLYCACALRLRDPAEPELSARPMPLERVPPIQPGDIVLDLRHGAEFLESGADAGLVTGLACILGADPDEALGRRGRGGASFTRGGLEAIESLIKHFLSVCK